MTGHSEIRTGDLIDGFRVGDKIHEGGMAVLYRVTAENAGMPLLMKVPRLEFGSHPSCYIGFEVEQMIMQVLGGPHVPRWVANGNAESTPYLVMEYIEGKTLQTYAAQAPLPAEQAAGLVAALAAAVHDLHLQEVIHLDIKPENVVYRQSGEAVLIDFGLAHHVHLPDLVEEEFHMPVGTSAYISPEQIRGNRNDPRSDLFALGVILYQLCTGYLPFGEPASLSGFRRRLYLDPLPPRQRVPELPLWMQEIILHCLEIDAGKRYATAAQLAYDLTHPLKVPLTERANRLERAGLAAIVRRWWRNRQQAPVAELAPDQQRARGAHIMVALDPDIGHETLLQELLQVVRRIAMADSHSRIMCVTVIEQDISSDQDEGREIANSQYTQRLVALHHWAEGLQLPPERLRFHVLPSLNVASALLEYAQLNHVVHIVMGARGSSVLRRILGSVSARVVTEAQCTVTVVRLPRVMKPHVMK